ncbi:MAG TPA: O-antigen ligase family protein [Dehalococcoidia bacterium]|nr:O-antigen ligase family protein [Dehalococcoidia bacterium]
MAVLESAERRGLALPWFPFLPLAVLVLVGATATTLQWLLVGAIAVLLALGVARPVWAAAAVVVLELTIGNYMVTLAGTQVSLRLVTTGAALLLSLYHLLRGARLQGGLLLLLSLAFLGVCGATAYLNTDPAQAFKALRFLATGLAAAVALAVGVQSRDDLRLLLWVGLVTCLLSALAAVSQHYNPIFGTPLVVTLPYRAGGPVFEDFAGRAIGLAENPLHLADDMMLGLLVLTGVFVSVTLSLRQRWALALSALLLLAALYFSYTRSWPLAAGVGALAFLAYRGPYRRDVWLGLLLVAAAVIYVSDVRANRYTVTEDDSTLSRPILWQAATWMALEHPYLGVGPGRFVQLAPDYQTAVDPELLRRERQMGTGSVLGIYTPHNDYLNVWVTYGLPALGLYLALLVATGLRLLRAYRLARDALLQGVVLGLLAALMAYAVNSAFHNYFDSAITLWLLVGAAAAVGGLVRREEADAVTAAPGR